MVNSKKPSKQRKRLFTAVHHRRAKMLSSHLSTDLKSKYGIKNIPLKVGDRVRIVRGDTIGTEGKIINVDRKKFKIYIEGITRKKSDGQNVNIPIHHSNVIITDLDTSDKIRKNKLNILSKESSN